MCRISIICKVGPKAKKATMCRSSKVREREKVFRDKGERARGKRNSFDAQRSELTYYENWIVRLALKKDAGWTNVTFRGKESYKRKRTTGRHKKKEKER